MNDKSVAALLNEMASKVCDDLCKWPEQYTDGDGEESNKLYEEHCNSCPLNILGI